MRKFLAFLIVLSVVLMVSCKTKSDGGDSEAACQVDSSLVATFNPSDTEEMQVVIDAYASSLSQDGDVINENSDSVKVDVAVLAAFISLEVETILLDLRQEIENNLSAECNLTSEQLDTIFAPYYEYPPHDDDEDDDDDYEDEDEGNGY